MHLEQAVRELKATLPSTECVQPPIAGYPCTTSGYLELLKMEFEEHDHVVFTEAEAVAMELGFTFEKGKNKTDERSLEKGRLTYYGKYSELKDLRRASIVCDTVSDIIKLVSVLRKRLQLLRVKNRFDRQFDANNETAGYRDLQLNVQIPNTRLIWELQVFIVWSGFRKK